LAAVHGEDSNTPVRGGRGSLRTIATADPDSRVRHRNGSRPEAGTLTGKSAGVPRDKPGIAGRRTRVAPESTGLIQLDVMLPS
jgi:hypothetical protein